MKAFFLTEKDITTLVGSIRARIEVLRQAGYPVTSDEMARGIIDDLKEIHSPINIDNVNVTELSEPCRFFPGKDIIGFTTSPGILKGVFIKENK